MRASLNGQCSLCNDIHQINKVLTSVGLYCLCQSGKGHMRGKLDSDRLGVKTGCTSLFYRFQSGSVNTVKDKDMFCYLENSIHWLYSFFQLKDPDQSRP
jgi:hypothetical protein